MRDKELSLDKRRDLIERTLDGETLILDPTNGRIHHLNLAASYVWNNCEGLSLGAIAERLAQVFQIDSLSAENDVIVLLDEMRAMNLLESSHNLT